MLHTSSPDSMTLPYATKVIPLHGFFVVRVSEVLRQAGILCYTCVHVSFISPELKPRDTVVSPNVVLYLTLQPNAFLKKQNLTF